MLYILAFRKKHVPYLHYKKENKYVCIGQVEKILPIITLSLLLEHRDRMILTFLLETLKFTNLAEYLKNEIDTIKNDLESTKKWYADSPYLGLMNITPETAL